METSFILIVLSWINKGYYYYYYYYYYYVIAHNFKGYDGQFIY
jgi:hypothetical protein